MERMITNRQEAEEEELYEPRLGVSCSCGHCHQEEDHNHDHDHGHAHSHSHSHSHSRSEEAGETKTLIIGAGLFALALVLHFLILKESVYSWPVILLLVLAYLILGKDVLLTSLRNIRRGEVFDENFLMSIATLGAFAIGEYPEAVGVMLFFRLGEMFEEMAVERSRKKILETVNLRAETVTLAAGEEVIPATKAKVGDVFLVKAGDRIPLDGMIVEGESFLDTSAITGEPVPRRVKKQDEVLAGCVNTQGVLKIMATKRLSESMTSRILHSVEEAQEQKPRIEHFITRFARVYTPIVVGLALFVALAMPLIRGEAFQPWLYTAISFLVMSCPCALVVSVPLAFFCGIGTASGKGILFKGGSAMEALSRVKAAVLDKTGTLTEGVFEVQEIRPAGGMAQEELLRLAAGCESMSRHPIAKSITEAAKGRDIRIPAARSVQETAGRGISGLVDDRQVICGTPGFLEGAGIALPLLEEAGGTRVLTAVDGVYAGEIRIADALKEDAAPAIQKMKSLGLTPAILTGDGAESARHIGEALKISAIRAQLLPSEKLSAMQELRGELGSVLYVGDGLNDAPVLAGADVGAAMGSGADAAIEAADLVFMNSNVSAIPQAVSLSRRSMRIARENVIAALGIKIIVMLLGISGIYSNMWLAVFADTGVLFLCILNSLRLLRWKA